MMLDLPFYKNDGDGNQCLQICAKIAIKHFLDKDYSLDELDKLSRRKAGLWTYTPQIVNMLYNLGLKVRLYSKEKLEPCLEGESFVRKSFGKNADKILKFTDMPVVVDSVKNLLEKDIFENKKISIQEIEDNIEHGNVVIALIDYNKIINRNSLYQGHSIVLTGFDEENIFYHESGPLNPELNKKVKKDILVEAMNANGTDNDCVIFSGIRS